MEVKEATILLTRFILEQQRSEREQNNTENQNKISCGRKFALIRQIELKRAEKQLALDFTWREQQTVVPVMRLLS